MKRIACSWLGILLLLVAGFVWANDDPVSSLSASEQGWLEQHQKQIVVGIFASSWSLDHSGRSDLNVYPDLFRYLQGHLGGRFIFRTYASEDRAYQALEQGAIDTLFINARHIRPSYPSTPTLLTLPAVILYRNELGKMQPEQALSRLNLVCVKGMTSCNQLPSMGVTQYRSVDSADEALFNLEYDHADGAILSLPLAQEMMLKLGKKHYRLLYDPKLPAEPLQFVVLPKRTVVLTLLETAMAKLSVVEHQKMAAALMIESLELEGQKGPLKLNLAQRQWLQQHRVLKVARPANWPPMSFTDEHGHYAGFSADLMQLLAERLGVQIKEMPTQNLAQSEQYLLKGEADLVPIATVQWQRFALVTQPFYKMTWLLVGKFNDSWLDQLSQLSNKKIAIVRGYEKPKWLSQVRNIQWVEVSEEQRVLQAVDEEGADYGLVAQALVGRALQSGYAGKLRVVYGSSRLQVPILMAVSPKEPMLQQILDVALSDLSNEDIVLLKSRWLTLDVVEGISPKKVLKYALIGIGLFVVGGLFLSLWILTLRRQISQRRTAEKMASEARSRLQDLTDSIPGVVFQYDVIGSLGQFSFVSAGSQQLLEISAEQLQTNLRLLLRKMVRADRSAIVKTLRTINLSSADNPLEIRFRIRTHNRALRWIRAMVVPYRNATQIRWCGAAFDMTEIKQQEQAIVRAKQHAEAAMETRSRFLAMMSHELRTPISGLLGLLEQLRLLKLNPSQDELVGHLNETANNLLYLVNDVLDFSKLEAHQLQLDYQKVCLWKAVGPVLRNHAAAAHGKGLHLQFIWQGEIGSCYWLDALRLGQILSNLLHNAVKFTHQGQIQFVMQGDDDGVSFIIQDSGIGIEASRLERLFDPFEQAENTISRRYGGSGLGLSISLQLTQLMGGKLTLQSTLGAGTLARCFLPLKRCDDERNPLEGIHLWGSGSKIGDLAPWLKRWGAQVEVSQQLPNSGLLLTDRAWFAEHSSSDGVSELSRYPSLGIVILGERDKDLIGLDNLNIRFIEGAPIYPDRLFDVVKELQAQMNNQMPKRVPEIQLDGRVLVVDDHPLNRMLVSRQLEQLGLECVCAEDGAQAWALWQQSHFDLLLTDCRMPVMDGFTLASKVRQGGSQGATCPILGMSADATEQVRQQCFASGMNDLLTRPFGQELLAEKIAALGLLSGLKSQATPQHDENSSGHVASLPSYEDLLVLFGSESLLQEMLTEYLRCSEADRISMTEALANGRWSLLAEAAHRFKGAAQMTGLNVVSALAKDVEQAARLRDEARCKAQLEALTIEHQQVNTQLRDYL